MDTTAVLTSSKTWVDFAFYAVDFLKYLAPFVIGLIAPSPIFNKMRLKKEAK